MSYKKTLLVLTFIFTVVLPIGATSDDSGFLGIKMYKFKKPRIVKEVTIIDVVPNSPAWNADIRIADRILKVNDKDVSAYSVEQIQNLIKGKVNEKVKLTLLTRYGIKEFDVARSNIDPTKIEYYPQWYKMCGDNNMDGETCFYHPGTYKSKFSDNFKFSGPIDVKVFGTKKASLRYQYEDDLRICQNAQDKSMCYMMLKNSINNSSYTQMQFQQQKIQNITQGINNANTNLELQNLNNNLQNTNLQLQNINNTLRNY